MKTIVNTIFNIYSSFKNIDAIALSLPGFINTDTGMHMGGGCFHSLKKLTLNN